jgi:hypothetical protein
LLPQIARSAGGGEMREIERHLYSHLSQLVAPAKVHAAVGPQTIEYPSVVYQVSMAAPVNTLCGTGRLVDNTVVLNLWGREYADCMALRELVVEGMTDFPLENILTLEMEDYDMDARVYRRILQYSIWEQE